jgi:flagellar biosynthesis chaperone FliJ
MATFRFRLQPLLDLKNKAKEDAEKALKDRKNELAAEQQKLEDARRREQELIALRLKLRREVMAVGDGQSVNATEVRRRVEYVKALGFQIDTAKEAVYAQQLAVTEAEEKVKQAQAHVLECNREVDVLTKYRKKLEERFQREEEQKEALELDEIGNVLYSTRRRP